MGKRGPEAQSLTCDCFLGFLPVRKEKIKSEFMRITSINFKIGKTLV